MAKKIKLPESEKSEQDVYQESTKIEEAELKQPQKNEEPEVEEVVAEEPEKLKLVAGYTAKKEAEFDKSSWFPKTKLGQTVKENKISIDELFSSNLKIMESEIVDVFFPSLYKDLIKIGQSRGKFGGGKRSIWKQTQKKTQEGNKPKFEALVIVGDKKGHIGIGYGKSKETVPARDKAVRSAKLSITKIYRGCGSWACHCKEQHSIPFKISGRCGSVRITLLPAPKGTGLCVEQECRKVLDFAGIKDVYSKTKGQTGTKINLIYACFKALGQLKKIKVQEAAKNKLGLELLSKI